MSTKAKFIAIITFCLFLMGVIGFFVIRKALSDQEVRRSHDSLSVSEMTSLRSGDIILRRGFGWMSSMILDALNETPAVSHCGIIIKQSSRLCVIHSISKSLSDTDGLRSEPLLSFIRQSRPNSIIIVRLKDINPLIAEAITKRSIYYLNKKVPFDPTFDMQDTSSFFCNELVRNIILDATGKDVYHKSLGSPAEQVKFGVFREPDLFDVIINHNK